jgi:hypothetical protein
MLSNIKFFTPVFLNCDSCDTLFSLYRTYSTKNSSLFVRASMDSARNAIATLTRLNPITTPKNLELEERMRTGDVSAKKFAPKVRAAQYDMGASWGHAG